MMMAPFASAFYSILYNYAIKLLLDLFTQNEKITFAQSYKPVMVFIAAQAILDVAWRVHNFAQLKAMPYIFQDMMNKICHHCFNLSYTYFQNNLSGSIVGRVRGIGDNYSKMHQAIEYKLSQTLLITLFSGVTLAYINIKIFIIIVGFIAVYLPLALRFFIKLARMEQDKQDSWYNLFGIVADCITNIFTIFSFAAKQRELNKIEDYYHNVHNILTTRYYKYDLIISIILNLVYWVYLIGVFVYVIHLRNLGEISIGDIAFIMSLTFLFAENSWHATMRVKDFLEDVAAFRSAFTIMQTPQDTIDKEDAAELKISKGEIIFKDISFAYKEGSSVFEHLNLHIKAGEKVGIVGHSGSGKSTLIALLLKNFKAGIGDIIIDNQSLYDIPLTVYGSRYR